MTDINNVVRCCSARQHIKLLFVADEARPHQRFFPIDKLQAYLTRDKVTWLLECPCNNCRKDYKLFKSAKSPTEFTEKIVGPEVDKNSPWDPSKTALALFALLISIERPLLIIGFVRWGCSDHTLETRTPNQFSEHQLQDGYCKDVAESSSKERFRQFAVEFAEALPKFAVPRMDSGVYSVYGADTILPFINEQKIAVREEDGTIKHEGAHGKVYSFEIYSAYQQFEHAADCKHFARKELDRNSEISFHLENVNLEHATAFQNKHIVRMIKAYKHGDTFNLIFPLAKTNLKHLLRDPSFDTSNSIHGPVESHAAWDQLLGVATALKQIGGPNDSNDFLKPSGKKEFHGMHFDLKPANILIDDSDTWIISDFGEAAFQETGRTTSRLLNRGGTDAYAPPEIDNLDAKYSRRYDVWSLGCIVLEVTAFVILGCEGLCGETGLDCIRHPTTPSNPRESLSRFFSQEAPQGKYIVKKEITDFMQSLPESERVRDNPKSQTFVASILELISMMLEPEAEFRCDIEEVIRRLSSSINTARDDVHHQGQMSADSGERAIGETKLKDMRVWHRRQGHWQEASIRIFEDECSTLRVCTALKDNTEQSVLFLKRNDTLLVPRYAFHNNTQRVFSGPEIYFTDSSVEARQFYRGLQLAFRRPKDGWYIQEILTGHKVEASFHVDNFKYREYVALTSRIASGFKSVFRPGKDEKEGDYNDLGTATVQLWTESSDQNIEAKEIRDGRTSAREETGRTVRRQPHQLPGYRPVPVRRMVIFIHNSRRVIMVAMDLNWDTEKKPKVQDGQSSPFLHFVPRNPSRDPAFLAANILPLVPHDQESPKSFPGIPLNPAMLRNIEHDSIFECNSMGLTFRDVEARKNFSDIYLTIWTEWHNQTNIAKKLPGYTPVPPPVHTTARKKTVQQPPKIPNKPPPKSPSWNIMGSPVASTWKSNGSSANKEGNKVRISNSRGGGRGGSRTVKVEKVEDNDETRESRT